MDCENVKNNIPLILTGNASEDEQRQVARHLQACRQCRDESKQMARIWSMLESVSDDTPSETVKTRLMATAQMVLQTERPAWWKSLASSSFFATVFSALGLFWLFHMIFPYSKAVVLCERNTLNGGLTAWLPPDLLYFALGVLYGLVPLALAQCFFSRGRVDRPGVQGLGSGVVTAAFLIPFVIIQCPQFTFSLILTMVLGITAGALTGGLGTQMAIRRMKTRK